MVNNIPCNDKKHTTYDSSDRFAKVLCSVSIDTIAKVLCRSVVFCGLGAWARASQRAALSRITGFASPATYVLRFLLAAMGAMTLGCAMSFGADYLPKKYQGSSLQRRVVRAMPPSLQNIMPSCTTMCTLIGYPLSIWFSSCIFMDWQP